MKETIYLEDGLVVPNLEKTDIIVSIEKKTTRPNELVLKYLLSKPELLNNSQWKLILSPFSQILTTITTKNFEPDTIKEYKKNVGIDFGFHDVFTHGLGHLILQYCEGLENELRPFSKGEENKVRGLESLSRFWPSWNLIQLKYSNLFRELKRDEVFDFEIIIKYFEELFSNYQNPISKKIASTARKSGIPEEILPTSLKSTGLKLFVDYDNAVIEFELGLSDRIKSILIQKYQV
jgi:hypothetical protein